MPATLEEFKNKVLQDAFKAKTKVITKMKKMFLKITEGKHYLEELRSEVMHYQKLCDQTNITRDHTTPGIVEAACSIGGLFVGDPTEALENGVETLYDTLSEATTDFVDFVNTSIFISKSRDVVSDLQTMVNKLQSKLIKYKEMIELLKNNPEEQSLQDINNQEIITKTDLQTIVDELKTAKLDDKKGALEFLENCSKAGDEISSKAADEILVAITDRETELQFGIEKILDMTDHTLLHGILADFCIKGAIENVGTQIHSWEDTHQPELEAIEIVIEKLEIVEEVINYYMSSMIKETSNDPNEDGDVPVSINDKFTKITMKEMNEGDDGISGDDALD